MQHTCYTCTCVACVLHNYSHMLKGTHVLVFKLDWCMSEPANLCATYNNRDRMVGKTPKITPLRGFAICKATSHHHEEEQWEWLSIASAEAAWQFGLRASQPAPILLIELHKPSPSSPPSPGLTTICTSYLPPCTCDTIHTAGSGVKHHSHAP